MNKREDRANSTSEGGGGGVEKKIHGRHFSSSSFCLLSFVFPSPSGSLQNRSCRHDLARCYEHSFGFKMASEYSSLIALWFEHSSLIALHS